MSAQWISNDSGVNGQAIIWLEITTQLAHDISHQLSYIL